MELSEKWMQSCNSKQSGLLGYKFDVDTEEHNDIHKHGT
jgi:hypothetical protein